MAGPGWYPDPHGRHQHRWWDGQRWTTHVADRGVASEEPGARAGGPDVAPARGGSRALNPKALLSLVLSVLAYPFTFLLVGPLLAIGGIVLGVGARRELRDAPEQTGDTLATAGIVLGLVALAAFVAVVAVIAAFWPQLSGTVEEQLALGGAASA